MNGMTSLLLAIGGDGASPEPPKEFRIFAKGANRTSKATVNFDDASAARVLAAFAEHGADLLPIDYAHMMVLGSPSPEGHAAAGWFKPEVRVGELWASEVTWTPRADAAIRAREFRFISPAVLRDQLGGIHKLINVALTNLPATKDLRALVASDVVPSNQETTEMELTATETAIFAALKVDSPAKALGTIEALVEESKKVATLSTENAALKLAATGVGVDKLLASAFEAGKVSEAELPKLREQGVKDVAWLSGYLAVKSAGAAALELKEKQTGTTITTLSDAELKVCELTGVTPEDFLATKNNLPQGGK
ncbi:MAG: hypothetical protein H0U56_15595 [Methylibium sp.]|nr:hypothetical protein [Methylibium sp.]